MFTNDDQLPWKYWEEYDKSYQEFLRLYDFDKEYEDDEAEDLAWQRDEEEYAHYMKQVTSEKFFIDNVLDGDEDYYWNLD
jgi:hypothetical protein